MGFTVVFIIIIVSVIISVTRAQKVKQEREEEERRRQERLRNQTANKTTARSSAAAKPSAATQSKARNYQSGKKADPFPEHKTDPFAAAIAKTDITLSPAQLNEWLLDFAAAEKSGVQRFANKTATPPFEKFLNETGFSHRDTRKLRGYAPQNRLSAVKVPAKIKPVTLMCGISNDRFTPLPQESKCTAEFGVKAQYINFGELPQKEQYDSLYQSFYVNKN